MEISNINIWRVKLEIINKYFKKEYEIKKEEIDKEAINLARKFVKGIQYER